MWGHHGLTAAWVLWGVLPPGTPLALAYHCCNGNEAKGEQSHCDASHDHYQADFRDGTAALPGEDAVRRNSSFRVLLLVGSVQGNVLDVCSPAVFSPNCPYQWGCAPDLPLLPALGSWLGLSWTHYRVVLVLHTSFVNASVVIVFWSYCIDRVYVPFSTQSDLNTQHCWLENCNYVNLIHDYLQEKIWL